MPTPKAPPRDRLIKARVQMLWQAPFFAHRALHLQLIEAPALPTAATDGRRFWFNPAWIQEQTDSQLKGLWVHEVLHVVNEHTRRRADRDHDDWNRAADLAIYHDTRDSGFDLPDDNAPAELLAQARGRSAEELYRLLQQPPPAEEQQPDAEQTPQDGAGPRDDSEEGQPGQDDGPQDEEQDEEQTPDKDGSDDDTPDKDGSGESDDGPQDADDTTQGQDDQDGADSPADDAADGPSSPQDADGPAEQQDGPPQEAPDPYGMGAVVDAPDDSPAARAEEQQLILQAAHAARGQGFMPAGVRLLIEELEHPPLDWRAILAEFVDRTARNDWTMNRPNPRYADTGFALPSLRSERLTIALAIDTSGSCMDAPTQGRFAAELDAVLASFPDLDLTVLYCDEQVHRVDHLAPEDRPWRPESIPGGGGTDFRPVFTTLDADPDGPPAALIYLTDLYGAFPDAAPDYPTLWVATTARPAPFGDTLRIPPPR